MTFVVGSTRHSIVDAAIIDATEVAVDNILLSFFMAMRAYINCGLHVSYEWLESE